VKNWKINQNNKGLDRESSPRNKKEIIMKPNLEEVMESIQFDNSDEFNESQLQELIKEKMPGYEIQTWDLDDYGTSSEIFGSAMAELEYHISKGKQIEDLQYYEEWCTDSCDAYFCILAFKIKED
jgi:hypothetical protein